MEKLELKGYAKINLGLDVVRRLENGYHEVKMIMQTVSLHDEITLTKKKEHGIDVEVNKTELSNKEDNLVYKAAELMIKEYNIDCGVFVKLKKNIPIAAGLAGGSTDAAAVFRGMNEMFNLNLSIDELQKQAVKLGADIPYCITGGTYLSEGIGEKLTVLNNTPQCYVLLAKPSISVSTKWVYENLHVDEIKRHPDIDLIRSAIEQNDLNKMCSNLENILENVTVNKYPVITEIKKIMNDCGAITSLMSGSGPTVFAIFNNNVQMNNCAAKLRQFSYVEDVHETTLVYGY